MRKVRTWGDLEVVIDVDGDIWFEELGSGHATFMAKKVFAEIAAWVCASQPGARLESETATRARKEAVESLILDIRDAENWAAGGRYEQAIYSVLGALKTLNQLVAGLPQSHED